MGKTRKAETASLPTAVVLLGPVERLMTHCPVLVLMKVSDAGVGLHDTDVSVASASI